MQSTEIIQHADDRACYLSRTEVLERVGQLAMLPNTEYATTAQVAEFYGVSITGTLRPMVNYHRAEFEDSGYRVMRGSELRGLKAQVTADERELPSTLRTGGQHAVWSRRAVLLAGMMIRNSDVARAIRAYLLSAEDYAREVVSPSVPETPADALADAIRAEIDRAVRPYADEMSRLRAEVDQLRAAPAALPVASGKIHTPDEVSDRLTPDAEAYASITDRPLFDDQGRDLQVGISQRNGRPYAAYFPANRKNPAWLPSAEVTAAFQLHAERIGATGRTA